jgi:hypothetical protein
MPREEQQQIKNELVKESKESGIVLRESLAKFKDEIREAVEKDILARQVISEIQPKTATSDGFFKHPATLLILGFIFTTGLGSFLTRWWKGYEQDNERTYFATQTRCERERQTKTEELKQKIEVKDEIIQRVAETNTAAEEILLYFEMEPSRKKREREERTAYWKQATRAWKTNEKILKQRLLLRFSNPNVSQLLDDMVGERSLVGVNINNEHEDMADGKTNCSKRIKAANACMIYITQNLMPQMIKMINEEILSDEKGLRAARCVDNTAPNANVNASPQVATPVTSKKTALAAEPCPELPKMLKMCGGEGHDPSPNKRLDLSEVPNPCADLLGMTEKCRIERKNARSKKRENNATHNQRN